MSVGLLLIITQNFLMPTHCSSTLIPFDIMDFLIASLKCILLIRKIHFSLDLFKTSKNVILKSLMRLNHLQNIENTVNIDKD